MRKILERKWIWRAVRRGTKERYSCHLLLRRVFGGHQVATSLLISSQEIAKGLDILLEHPKYLFVVRHDWDLEWHHYVPTLHSLSKLSPHNAASPDRALSFSFSFFNFLCNLLSWYFFFLVNEKFFFLIFFYNFGCLG